MKAISIYLTCKNNAEAKKIAKALIDKKLVACANIFPVDSLFLWKKKVEKGKEAAIVFKTLKKNVAEAERLIKKLHSYDMPVYSIEEVAVSKEVAGWLKSELK